MASARQLRQLVADLHRDGTTIFLTTHYIEEAERLCDRIAFIVSGRIVRIDTVEHLVQPAKERHVVEITCANMPSDIRSKLSNAFPHLAFSTLRQRLIRVEADEPVQVGHLVRFLEEQEIDVLEARRVRQISRGCLRADYWHRGWTPCTKSKKKGEATNEALDRLLEYFA